MDIKEIKLWVTVTGSGHVLWRSEVSGEFAKNPEKLPVVDLSRTKHGCMFRIDKVYEHDYHAPSRFKDETDRQNYINRVVSDTKVAASKTIASNANVGDVVCGYKRVM